MATDRYRAFSPFASQLRTNGPEAKITANEIRDLKADRLKRLDGQRHLLDLIDNRLAKLASLDAPPTLVFVALPAEITKRYWAVHQMNRGVETVWNLRAGIKARAMQRGLRTQLLQQETIESDLEAHTSDLDHPADLAWNLFTAVYFKAGGFPWAPIGIPEGTCHPFRLPRAGRRRRGRARDRTGARGRHAGPLRRRAPAARPGPNS